MLAKILPHFLKWQIHNLQEGPIQVSKEATSCLC